MSEPSENGLYDKSPANGRFLPGNRLGRGNPHARAVNRLRSVALASVTDDDLKAVVVKLVEMAKNGNLAAIKLLMERTLGKPASGTSSRLPVESPKLPAATSGPVTEENLEERRAANLARFEQSRQASTGVAP